MNKLMTVLIIVGTLINTVIANGQTISDSTNAEVDSVATTVLTGKAVKKADKKQEKLDKKADKKEAKEDFQRLVKTAEDTLEARKGLVASIDNHIKLLGDTIAVMQASHDTTKYEYLKNKRDAAAPIKAKKKEQDKLKRSLIKAKNQVVFAKKELKKTKKGKGKYTPSYGSKKTSSSVSTSVIATIAPVDSLKKDSTTTQVGTTSTTSSTKNLKQGDLSEATRKPQSFIEPTGTTEVGRVINIATEPKATAIDGSSIDSLIRVTSRMYPFGSSIKAAIDTSMSPGVYQIDGMQSLAGVHGPDTQYLIHYLSKTTNTMAWALAQDNPADILATVYAPGATSTTITYRQGDGDENEEIYPE